jgi:hypothetical protein
MKYTEYQLQCAIDETLTTGNPAKAAKEGQAPRTTLRHRLKERRQARHIHSRRL